MRSIKDLSPVSEHENSFLMLMGAKLLTLECVVQLTFSFHLKRIIHSEINSFVLSIMYGLSVVVWIFWLKYLLGGSSKSFWVCLLIATVFTTRNITAKALLASLCKFVMYILRRHSSRGCSLINVFKRNLDNFEKTLCGWVCFWALLQAQGNFYQICKCSHYKHQ